MFARRNVADFGRSLTQEFSWFDVRALGHGWIDWDGVAPALGGFDELAMFFFFFKKS